MCVVTGPLIVYSRLRVPWNVVAGGYTRAVTAGLAFRDNLHYRYLVSTYTNCRYHVILYPITVCVCARK